MTLIDKAEQERLEELYGFDVLDSDPEKEFEELVKLASLICGTPISLITLIDKDRQWFKARIGIEESQTSRDVAFCDHAIKNDHLMIVENALNDKRFASNPFVLKDPNIRFYAGMPLITSNGYKLGTLCVLDSIPKTISQEQQFSLEILAKQVIRQLEFRKLNIRLKRASERLRQATMGAKVGTFELDFNTKMLECDDVVYSLYGISRNDYPDLLQFWRQALRPADLEKTRSLFASAARGESDFDTEVKITWSDGSPHYIKTRAETIRDAHGKPSHLVGAAWDITEQKLIEEQLKLSNERDSIFVQQSPNALAMFDKNMHYMAVSQQWIHDYKLEGQEIIGHSHYEIFPEISTEWKQIYQECLKGAINKSKEVYFQRADGTVQWITWDIRPWYITPGVIGGILMYTADITHQKAEEKEKKRAEEILDRTNEVARIGTWELDTVTNKVTWSRVIREIYEVPPDYDPGTSTRFHLFSDPVSRAKLEAAVQAARTYGTPYDLELKMTTAKGREIWVRTVCRTEMENGKCIRLYGIFQDINEIKTSEQKLKDLSEFQQVILNGTDYSIISIDAQGTIMTFNRGAEKMLGYKAEEVIGKASPNLFHEPAEVVQRAKKLSEELGKEIKPGVDLFTYRARQGFSDVNEWLFLRKDGSRFSVELSVTSLRNSDNVITGFLGIAKDITESKKAKEAIIQAKNLAEQSSELKETFLANMSHEIRTPMNAIIGFTDLLLKKDLGGEEREYVQIVKNSGENLLRIINDILDISKINSGMMTFEEHPINIPEIFTSLKTMLLPKASQKSLSLSFEADASLTGNVLGDPTRLTQILLNLLGNAIKFTQHGGVFVSARILEQEDHPMIEFRVKDTGIGIPEDKLKHIFERFSQAEKHTTRNYGGTGLGLSIAKQLIELQGGKIHIRSKVGQGSEFIFELPLRRTTALKNAPASGRRFDPDALTGMRVLIVDDNPVNIKLVLSMFSDYNIHTDIAENGRQAVEKVSNNTFDLVLMDIEMPEMSGYEATEVIRNQLKNSVPIIAMSAHAMSAERERSLRLGMNDYLSKPIKAELLLEKMAQTALKKELYKDTGKAGKLIDLTSLKESMHGRISIVLEILDMFQVSVSEDLEVISTAISKGDYNSIKRRCHRMKSTILTVGVEAIAMILKEMESISVTNSGLDKLKILNEELNILSKQAISEIELEKLSLKSEMGV